MLKPELAFTVSGRCGCAGPSHDGVMALNLSSSSTGPPPTASQGTVNVFAYDPEADAIGRKLAALPLGPLCRAWCGGLVWGLWGGPLRSLGLVLAS